MKKKLSVSIEENLLVVLDSMINGSKFRNKSHFVEIAINKLVLEENKENGK